MIKLLKIEKLENNGEKYISLQLEDTEKNKVFWIDCGLMDGYGNKCNFKTDDLFIDWSFNQYIFNLENEKDLQEMERLNDYYIEERDDGTSDNVIRLDIAYTETFI